MDNPVLVGAWRGGAIESAHRGAWAVVEADGRVVQAVGDVDRPVFPRSAVKLLQALPLVASGAAEAFGLQDAELALACASHGGEPEHVRTAAAMLAKAGLGPDALGCGSHWPVHEGAQRALARSGAEPGALHNNCSGKHAGFACVGCLLARQRGEDPARFVHGYVAADHPVMREVTAALQAATGHDLSRAPVGIDGCSIPTYGIPLRSLALGFARAATGQGLSPDRAGAALRLRQAIARAPFMVAGSDRFDTAVMQHFGERVCCKVGAEGVYCAALPERGWGVALKIDDGQGARAAEVVMARLLLALVAQNEADAEVLRPRVDVRLRNWQGLGVGRLSPSATLEQWVQALPGPN